MIKLEFPSNRPDIAAALGAALISLGGVSAPGAVELKAEPCQGETATQRVAAAFSPGVTLEEKAALGGGDPAGTYGQHEVQDEDEPPEAGGGEVDLHGVPFDGHLCARAAVPFYASGPNSGQWKKRKGVDDGEYNKWYAGQLKHAPAKLDTTASASPFAAPAQTQVALQPFASPHHPSVFGQQQPQAAAHNAPTNGSELMGWIAGEQAQGKITQEAITAAWVETGLQVGALFPTTPPPQVAANCAAIYRAILANV